MKENTTISVITPLYHGEKYIKKLIHMIKVNAEIAYQSCCIKLEYILVNDSPEMPINIDESDLVDILFKVQVVENQQNMGIHASRVAGLKACSGEYVLFLDQDDEIREDAVKVLYKRMIRQEQGRKRSQKTQQNSSQSARCDVVVGNGYRCDLPIYSKEMTMVNREKIYLYGTDMIFSPGQCLIRKEAIPQEWKENILRVNGCDDCLLWLMMLDRKSTFAAVNKKVYTHIENDENYSNASGAMADSFYAMCDLLDQISWYDKKKVSILRRRYHLKESMKSTERPAIYKAAKALSNIDVIIVTMYYKLNGFR